ncbi:MAG TPA: AAA family ATPase, partial [Pyrinomonadaceae bacterium]
PQVLLLDEPSAGLDPHTRLLLLEIILEYNQSGKTILLTTHNMEEADALCQRLAIIDHGRNIALGTPAELKASVPGGYLLRVRFGRHSPELFERLNLLAGVREVRVNADTDAITKQMFMPIAAVHSFQKSRASPSVARWNCQTYTSRNRASKTCSCTTPDGVCVNELENFLRAARA